MRQCARSEAPTPKAPITARPGPTRVWGFRTLPCYVGPPYGELMRFLLIPALLVVFLAVQRKRKAKAAAGALFGAAIGGLVWMGGTALLAFLSANYDTDIESDTIIFHGFGAAALVMLMVGSLLVPIGAVIGALRNTVARDTAAPPDRETVAR